MKAPEEFGPYLVYERLGMGGMATVHRAKKRGIAGYERGVALKRMLPHLAEDTEFIESFVREAKLVSQLVHPNIAQIYDFGRVGATYYIAMEHVDGFDVRKMLRYSNRHKDPLPLNVVLSILCELCEALEYAHTFVDEDGQPQGIIHRDVSPSNLIVAHSGHLKVIDFGIARATARKLNTETGRVKGKLGYMSPEAVTGRAAGPASDVFSAGVVAHELLTAQPLFSAKTDYDTLIRIHEAEIPPPSRRNAAVPAALDDVVLGALARDPDRRYATAAAFREALEEVAVEAGIKFSSRDVTEWRARIATAEDPWSSRTPPTTGTGSVSRPISEITGAPGASGIRPGVAIMTGTGMEEDEHSALHQIPEAPPLPEPPSVRSRPSAPSQAPALAMPAAEPPSPRRPPVASVVVAPALPAAPPPVFQPPPALPAASSGSRSMITGALIAGVAIAAAAAVYLFVLRKDTAPAPAAATAGAATASIKFDVQPPDAIVEVGGKAVGHASPFETRLDPGVISITVRKPGYKPWSTQLALRDGDKQTVAVALEAGIAHLSITSQPAGLAVQLDGKPLDQVTPVELQTKAGTHQVVVTNAAGATWAQDFTAEIDGKYAFTALLTAAATKHAAAGAAALPGTKRPAHGAAGRDSIAADPHVEPEPVAPPTKLEPAPAIAVPEPAKPVPSPAALPAVPAAPGKTPVVATTAVTKLAGEIPTMQVSGVTESFADVMSKLCIDERGSVASVKIIRALPEIAGELQQTLQHWRYKPYVNAAGQVSPACFPVSFRVVFKRAE